MTEGIAPHLLEPPVNVLRASLHPDGAAARIVNLGQWRAHLLERLGRQAVATGDPALVSLHEELSDYPAPPAPDHSPGPEIAVPLRIRSGDAVLSFISTIATFGTATEVTVAELAIEAFFPADADTAAALHRRAAR